MALALTTLPAESHIMRREMKLHARMRDRTSATIHVFGQLCCPLGVRGSSGELVSRACPDACPTRIPIRPPMLGGTCPTVDLCSGRIDQSAAKLSDAYLTPSSPRPAQLPVLAGLRLLLNVVADVLHRQRRTPGIHLPPRYDAVLPPPADFDIGDSPIVRGFTLATETATSMSGHIAAENRVADVPQKRVHAVMLLSVSCPKSGRASVRTMFIGSRRSSCLKYLDHVGSSVRRRRNPGRTSRRPSSAVSTSSFSRRELIAFRHGLCGLLRLFKESTMDLLKTGRIAGIWRKLTLLVFVCQKAIDLNGAMSVSVDA